MFRSAFVGFALICLSGPALAGDEPTVIRVVAPDGKPAKGTKVWVYEYTGTDEPPKEPAPLTADSDGKLTVPSTPGARRSQQLFARDAAGRIGRAWVNAPWREPVDDRGIEVVLVDISLRAGRVTTADGRPVVGAVVTPGSYYVEDPDRPREGGPASSISLPRWEQTRLTVKTDSDGRFQLAAPTAGYVAYYQVKAEGFGETKWSAPSGVAFDTPLPRAGTVTITVTGLDPSSLKGKNWQLRARDGTPAPGVRPVRYRAGSFDGTAKLAVRDLMPGTYELTMYGEGEIPGVFVKPPPVEVASGKSAEIVARFGPAAKVTGTITDKDGKGVAKVRVTVSVSDGTGPQPHTQLSAETDADGKYTAYGPAGWYKVWLQGAPDGYALPVAGRGGQLVEQAKVEVGKPHTFAPIKLLKAVTFSGQVVLADDKPAVGATVDAGSSFVMQSHGGPVTTDKDGRFGIPNLPPDDAVAPRVRRGKAVNVPETFELEKTTGPVVIEVSEANAATLRGRVVDGTGKPIAGAKVGLRHGIQGVGRSAQYGSERQAATTTTGTDGRYTFTGLWPQDRYRVRVAADGYAEAETKQVRGETGQTHDFGDMKLSRASLEVRGTVVGPDGKPVAGAEVFGVDGPSRFSSSSAADGSFKLVGFYEGAGFVFVKKDGFRLAAVAVTPGDGKPVTVTLSKADGSTVPPPEVPPGYRAALDDFTRHALARVWEAHPKFGYGGNALEDMARIDPATARKWRDEEKRRTNGKTDYTRLIDRVHRQKTLFDTAKDDPDEALAMIAALKPDDGFAEAKSTGERMLAVDKAKALRFAEEAVVRARQRDLPARVWSLAEAGDLAVRAGGTAGGKKVLVEAAELASKIEPDNRGRNSFTVGYTAAHLAPHDWTAAEKLLNGLKNPSDFNRFLAASAARIARTDLPKAKLLLGRFKPDNTYYSQEAHVRIAYAIATERPDEAVKVSSANWSS